MNSINIIIHLLFLIMSIWLKKDTMFTSGNVYDFVFSCLNELSAFDREWFSSTLKEKQCVNENSVLFFIEPYKSNSV